VGERTLEPWTSPGRSPSSPAALPAGIGPTPNPEHWAAAIDLNLRAPMLVTQEALPKLGGGVVVNVASTAGLGSDEAGSPEYAAAKAGLIRFTRTVRPPGVRVNGIAPDWIHTPGRSGSWRR